MVPDLNVLISPRGTANLAGRSLGYQVYLIPRLLGLFLMRCKAIRPICRSASFAPPPSPGPPRRPLAIISPLGTSSLPLFFIAASKLEAVAKVRAAGGGYKRRPGGCRQGAASHCPPLPDHPHLHPHRLEMVSTQDALSSTLPTDCSTFSPGCFFFFLTIEERAKKRRKRWKPFFNSLVWLNFQFLMCEFERRRHVLTSSAIYCGRERFRGV